MEDKKSEFKHLVRIANTDLKGEKPIAFAMKNIKGIGLRLANAVCGVIDINKNKKVGDLSDEEIKKIDEIVKSPLKNRIPTWMANRRRDPEDNQDKHLVTTDLMFTKDNDIKMMKKMKYC